MDEEDKSTEEKEWVFDHETLTGLWAYSLIGIKVNGRWANPDIALASRPELVTAESGQLKLQAIECDETLTWRFKRL